MFLTNHENRAKNRPVFLLKIDYSFESPLPFVIVWYYKRGMQNDSEAVRFRI